MILQTAGLVLLGILKFIGILFLIIVSLILILLLTVLFVPVRYAVSGFSVEIEHPKEESETGAVKTAFRLEVKVSWLLRLFRFCLHYGKDGLTNHIFIAGIDPLKALARRNEKKQQRRQKKAAKEQQAENITLSQEDTEKLPVSVPEKISVPPKEERVQIQMPETDAERIKESDKELTSDTGQAKKKSPQAQAADRKKKLKKQKTKKTKTKKKKTKPEKKEKQDSGFTKMRDKAGQIHTQITDEANRRAGLHAWTELCFLLYHYKPGKLKADIEFSLGNPALTGEVLGAVSLMPFIYRYPCSIIPDFETESMYIKGYIHMHGKAALWRFVLSALRLYRDKEFKRLIKVLQGKQERQS